MVFGRYTVCKAHVGFYGMQKVEQVFLSDSYSYRGFERASSLFHGGVIRLLSNRPFIITVPPYLVSIVNLTETLS